MAVEGMSVYGHGSWFTGAGDASDVDVLVVTDQPMSREQAAVAVAPLLTDAAGLALDVSVTSPEKIGLIERAVIATGELLAGPPIDVDRLRPYEWAYAMSRVADDQQHTTPGGAALAAVLAVAARDGRVLVGKAAAVEAAAGSRWEDIAGKAWTDRHAPRFDHPDLAALLEESRWAPAGVDPLPDDPGLALVRASRKNLSALATVFRQALHPDEVARLAEHPADAEQEAGWRKSPVADDALTNVMHDVASLATTYWLRPHTLAGIEPPECHRYPAGTSFPGHVDRLPAFPSRLANVVAMIQPATAGGVLRFDIGGWFPVAFDPGDVIVFDGSVLHGVTDIEDGVRVTLVSHAHMER